MGKHETAFLPDPEAEESLAAARLHYARRALERAVDHGIDLIDALRLPRLADEGFDGFDAVAIGFVVRKAIRVLDAIDAPGEDREPWLSGFHSERWTALDGECDDYDDEESDFGEDDGTAEPSLGAPEPTWGFVGASVNQAPWARAGDDDREQDDDREPSLSVVEWDGRGDNWHRSGRTTEPEGPDIEAVNEDGAQLCDEDGPFWSLTVGCNLGGDHYTV